MALIKNIFKYKKLIMLVLIVLGFGICVLGAYQATYKKNVIEATDVIPNTLTGYEKSTSEDFLSNFDKFEIKQTSFIKPWTDNNGNTVVGLKTFTVSTQVNANSKIRGKIKVTIGLGANWVSYISETFGDEVTLGKDTDLTININFDDLFPKEGNLWFIEVEQPTLYVLVEWSEELNTKPYKYAYLEFDYSQYGPQQ